MNVAMGARLGQARLAANMSIAQLADALGIGVEELEAYEAGAMRMPSSILVRILRHPGDHAGLAVSNRPREMALDGPGFPSCGSGRDRKG